MFPYQTRRDMKAASTEKADRMMVYFDCFTKAHERATGSSFGKLLYLQDSRVVCVA